MDYKIEVVFVQQIKIKRWLVKCLWIKSIKIQEDRL